MNTQEVLITPNIAKAWLTRNKLNRPISREAVDRYARDMKNGNWKTTHQGLLLGKDRMIVDGQHRLHGIVQSGVSLVMLVSQDDTITSPLDLPIDTGNKRKTSFILGIPHGLSGAASLAVKVVSGIRVPTPSDMRSVGDKLKPYYEILTEGKQDTRRGVTTSGVQLAAMAKMMTDGDVAYINSTYNSMKLDKFNEMPPIAASFYKQVVVERANLTASQILARAIRVFDENKANISKLSIKSEEFAFEEARNIVALAIK